MTGKGISLLELNGRRFVVGKLEDVMLARLGKSLDLLSGLSDVWADFLISAAPGP